MMGTLPVLRRMRVTREWIAERSAKFDSSGIRRMFQLARQVKDPVNLSIGQPDFPVPAAVKRAMIEAIEADRNGYTLTEGIPPLRDKLQAEIDRQFGQADRKVMVCSGTSGGLTLASLGLVNPGEEVIYFDPYFVMYPGAVALAGGKPVPISTYPDFRLPIEKVAAAITPRTKMILLNSPGNPTGVCYSREELRQIAELAAEHKLCLVSDEIYSRFSFDEPHCSPAEFNPQTVVVDGFSKPYAMTGLRSAYVHGPAEVIDALAQLQQLTFVNAPQPVQWGSIAAMDVDIQPLVNEYRRRRDFLLAELQRDYEIPHPGGAFYLFPKLPWGTGEEFFQAALAESLLVIPGTVFSERDSHFRISYAADERTLQRGVEILKRLARR
ncbi:MAG: pyridoxal phosphate-dependent aminotransferase [Planctomycetota bacterium]